MTDQPQTPQNGKPETNKQSQNKDNNQGKLKPIEIEVPMNFKIIDNGGQVSIETKEKKVLTPRDNPEPFLVFYSMCQMSITKELESIKNKKIVEASQQQVQQQQVEMLGTAARVLANFQGSLYQLTMQKYANRKKNQEENEKNKQDEQKKNVEGLSKAPKEGKESPKAE